MSISPERLTRMREAVVAARAAVRALRDGLAGTERELAGERRQLADAERRGRLAAGIGDDETVQVAQKYAVKHGERVRVLERKLAAQREELALAERDAADMTAELKQLELGIDPRAASRPDPEPDEDPLLRFKLDRAAREAEADDMLRDLKRRMGKE